MNLPKILDNPLFETFWKAYPHKVGKVAAQKAWKKISPDAADTEKILDSLAKQKQSRMWKEGIGIPHPATYLNQARFLDEPIAEVKKEDLLKTSFNLDRPCEFPSCMKKANTRTVRGFRCAQHITK